MSKKYYIQLSVGSDYVKSLIKSGPKVLGARKELINKLLKKVDPNIEIQDFEYILGGSDFQIQLVVFSSGDIMMLHAWLTARVADGMILKYHILEVVSDWPAYSNLMNEMSLQTR